MKCPICVLGDWLDKIIDTIMGVNTNNPLYSKEVQYLDDYDVLVTDSNRIYNYLLDEGIIDEDVKWIRRHEVQIEDVRNKDVIGEITSEQLRECRTFTQIFVNWQRVDEIIEEEGRIK